MIRSGKWKKNFFIHFPCLANAIAVSHPVTQVNITHVGFIVLWWSESLQLSHLPWSYLHRLNLHIRSFFVFPGSPSGHISNHMSQGVLMFMPNPFMLFWNILKRPLPFLKLYHYFIHSHVFCCMIHSENFEFRMSYIWPPLWSSGWTSRLQIRRSGFDSQRYHIFWEVVGLEWGPLTLMSTIEDLLGVELLCQIFVWFSIICHQDLLCFAKCKYFRLNDHVASYRSGSGHRSLSLVQCSFFILGLWSWPITI
jgi:hypothetical protein